MFDPKCRRVETIEKGTSHGGGWGEGGTLLCTESHRSGKTVVKTGADGRCEEDVQVSKGTSSSEVASSDIGMSKTSSSEEEEEEEENEGEADRGMELVEEGEALKREMLRPIVWKMEDREGLLGGTATGGVSGAVSWGAGGAYGGGGVERTGGEVSERRGGDASSCCCCCSV